MRSASPRTASRDLSSPSSSRLLSRLRRSVGLSYRSRPSTISLRCALRSSICASSVSRLCEPTSSSTSRVWIELHTRLRGTRASLNVRPQASNPVRGTIRGDHSPLYTSTSTFCWDSTVCSALGSLVVAAVLLWSCSFIVVIIFIVVLLDSDSSLSWFLASSVQFKVVTTAGD